jgi:hypothetical protein
VYSSGLKSAFLEGIKNTSSLLLAIGNSFYYRLTVSRVDFVLTPVNATGFFKLYTTSYPLFIAVATRRVASAAAPTYFLIVRCRKAEALPVSEFIFTFKVSDTVRHLNVYFYVM